MFGAAAVLAAERLTDRGHRALLWAAVATIALAIGLSRVIVNVHYVSDVVAGWRLGLAWLATCLLARDRFRTRTRGI